MAKQRHVVGVFSRDADVNFVWLLNMLQSIFFQKVVKDARPVYISNNRSDFHKELSKYTFAILYHTQKRGRLNVTNVTDSLYDDELDAMWYEYGKENVIVLLDDLDDSNQQKKFQILNEQFDIENKAAELFLISEMDKESCNLNSEYPIWSEESTAPRLREEHRSMLQKRMQIRDILSKASVPELGRDSPGSTISHGTSASQNYPIKDNREYPDYRPQTASSAATNSTAQSNDNAPLIYSPSSGNKDYDVQKSAVSAHKDSNTPANRKLCGKLSDKAVFIILGVSGGVLLIVLIIVLATL
uniref:Uncharacterized protein n=1 Tax=Leptobrachium leishanense TaxID=445787 RepID=A0A8C5QKQ8_9ANUR